MHDFYVEEPKMRNFGAAFKKVLHSAMLAQREFIVKRVRTSPNCEQEKQKEVENGLNEFKARLAAIKVWVA